MRDRWATELAQLPRETVEAWLVLGNRPLDFVYKSESLTPPVENDALALLSPLGKPKLRKGTPTEVRKEWARRLHEFRIRTTSNHEGIQWFLSEELDTWRLHPCGTKDSR